MNTLKAFRTRTLGSVLFAALAASCTPGEEETSLAPVSDDAYVQVMTELMLLDANPPSGETVYERRERADSIRSEILAAQGITAGEVIDFVESMGGEAAHMESLWERITHRYDSIRIADLRSGTEARSESEGRLGEEARSPEAAGRPDSASSGEAASSARRRELRPPAKSRPAVRDTSVPSG